MSTFTYPGVYIEELSSGVHTITGVATSIAAFVGWAPQGPVTEATLVESWSDYQTLYGGLDARSQRRKHEKETLAGLKERPLPSGGEPFQFEFRRIERTAGRREIGSFKFVPSRLGARFARICESPPDDRFGWPPNRAGMRYGAPRRSFSNRAWIRRPNVRRLFDHAFNQQSVENVEADGVYGCVQLGRHLRQREIETVAVGGISPRRPTLDARSNAPCG